MHELKVNLPDPPFSKVKLDYYLDIGFLLSAAFPCIITILPHPLPWTLLSKVEIEWHLRFSETFSPKTFDWFLN